MIDLGIIATAKRAVETKPRRFVTPAILLAVVMQESSGVAIFIDTKPGSLFAANMYEAKYPAIFDRDGKIIGRANTGLTDQEIKQAVIIPAEIDGWRVPKELVGKVAKFRFEYSYWKRYGSLPKVERFRMSSSWGLVQFMGPNVVKGAKDPDLFIQRFAADLPLQLLYAAGMIDDLLGPAGDVERMYRAYNSGNPDSKNSKVVARAVAVEKSAISISAYLRSK